MFVRFGMRDVTLRYRQTVLGMVWVVLQPLISAGVFAVVFGGVAHLPSGGTPYILLSMAGMLAWGVFSGVVSRASSSLVGNAALISKVYFPRILVPLSTAYSVCVDFVVSLVFFVALLFVYRVNPGWAVLLLPAWLTLLLLISCGVGFVCASLMVKYRDIQYIVPVAVQTLLYASPVAYSLSAVPDRYRWLFEINPLTWILQEFRWSLLNHSAPPLWQIAGSIVVAIAVFLLGTALFEQMERGFADFI